jgi:hypothetical protein
VFTWLSWRVTDKVGESAEGLSWQDIEIEKIEG